MEPKITKETNLGDLMIKFPKAAQILLEEGIGCMGCGAAQFETIEQGLAVHGKSEEEIEKIVGKMNKAVSE